jgi:hypothetical protein
MSGGIFLSVKDLMRLKGSENYRSAAREHSDMRATLAKRVKKRNKRSWVKRHLTIREYCLLEDLDFKEVWEFLRGENLSEGNA